MKFKRATYKNETGDQWVVIINPWKGERTETKSQPDINFIGAWLRSAFNMQKGDVQLIYYLEKVCIIDCI